MVEVTQADLLTAEGVLRTGNVDEPTVAGRVARVIAEACEKGMRSDLCDEHRAVMLTDMCRMCILRDSLLEHVEAAEAREALWREYVALLSDEISELVSLTVGRNIWKSTRVQEGKRLREALGLKASDG